ncbi:YggS family pyridoxal phosphate-dependent enzyme [Planctomyces sp. SH-PL14]|uniref:YggS family pyridoxal phosphate-dependent enzyme n=1 Tax=Planctomyces sp. SH-PL14 TaxID=1632864 RepID=UPI00078CD4CC|nr:YggS family pyridoxal phosphate-dependent enzyme [Planctomyces sp. SH-PL14]AMV18009.1 hypothetical protein VT03_08975 [Planctomyces sp. SH-PL14]
MSDRLTSNWTAVRAEIAAACERANRPVDSVRLVAVTKYAEMDWVRGLVALGQTALGENRPQQLIERAGTLQGAEWHLIGHLQRNKVRAVLPFASCIHSIDSLKLLARIGEIAGELGLTPRVLLEVNVSGEESKDGFSAATVRGDWPQIQAVENVTVAGLMTMAPLTDDPQTARPVFRRLRELRDELQASAQPGIALSELSMGMSGDFAVAIEEGSTMVRVGSRLFEGLSPTH